MHPVIDCIPFSGIRLLEYTGVALTDNPVPACTADLYKGVVNLNKGSLSSLT